MIPAYDVQKHRKNEDKERQTSRGYQALVLLSIAKKQSEKTALCYESGQQAWTLICRLQRRLDWH